jgi:hypothetical protein
MAPSSLKFQLFKDIAYKRYPTIITNVKLILMEQEHDFGRFFSWPPARRCD